MADRNIEAIEHRGRVYVSLDDMQTYLADLFTRANGASGQEALNHVLDQLATIRDKRPA